MPVWLFVRDPADLQEQEQRALTAIRQASPTADTVYTLAQQFMRMIRQLEGEHLDEWLGLVRASQIPELQSFVRSIERDKAAVLAGLSLPHNNGVVEGKVNKLKRDLAHDVRKGRLPAVTSACSSCAVRTILLLKPESRFLASFGRGMVSSRKFVLGETMPCLRKHWRVDMSVMLSYDE